ncbi:sensor histidine kinase [Enterococcus sp. AZ072]|uniref:sensor histidine kinase n=1 Tax=unclassified Enterococcus TaxID=2608891 RepID=UPI003D2E33DF
MIKKFRRRLIAMTTGFVTVILIVAFLAIFLTTYLRVQSDNFEKLNQAEELKITGGKVHFDDSEEEALQIDRIVPGGGVYFNMLVDKAGKPIMIDSAIKLSKKDYNKAAKIAWKNQEGGVTRFGNRDWQYVVAPAIATLNYDEEDKNIGKEDETYLIRFLDVTDSKKSLKNLAMTLLIVGIGLLIFFYLVIIYFTNRAMKPLEEAWHTQKQFIANASHELKTPLSIISTNVGVLYSSKEDTIEEQIKWLDNISRGTKRMTGLINKLLTIAKTDNMFEPLNFTKVRVDRLLEEALNNYQEKFDSKQVTVKQELFNITAKTDEVLLIQLFEIFIDNACKYTNDGGTFEVKMEESVRKCIIRFKNTGAGIAEEDLPKVFERFYRTNEVRQKYEGSYGLGLSIAQNIVEQLNGKISVTSKVNEETEFVLHLILKRE